MRETKIEEIQDPPLLSKGGSRWFEVLRVSGLRGGHEAYGKEMRLTPRDLQRGLKLTVLY